jgi:hypothetical protein
LSSFDGGSSGGELKPMTLNSTMSNVIIEDNTFDFGNFAPNTNLLTIPTTYSYTNCLWTNADARIDNNYFSGILGTSPFLVVTGIGSCNIFRNTFLRGSNTIPAYIDVSGVTNDQIIVDNVFDQYTVDGINEKLVLLPAINVFNTTGPFILYERNKNQTAVKQIQKSPYQVGSIFTPKIANADRAEYLAGPSPLYEAGNGFYFLPTLTTSFTEGIAVNYTTPFSNTLAFQLPGFFSVTAGSSAQIYPSNGSSINIISPTNIFGYTNMYGYVIFGNDNVYYPAYLVGNVTTPFTITGIQLGGVGSPIPYLGATNPAISATFILASIDNLTNQLNYYLPGPYSITNGLNTVTGSTANLIAGSQIVFAADPTQFIYTVESVTSTNSFVLTSPYVGASGVTTTAASTGLATAQVNFSINLSEILPTNVQVVSAILGVSPQGATSFVSAFYYASMSTDSGNTFTDPNLPEILPGTFTLTTGNTIVPTSVTQGGIGIGSNLIFASQPWINYTVASVGPTSITLTAPYTPPPGYPSPVITTATCFDDSLADVVNYNPVTAFTDVYGGQPPTLSINNGSVVTQYLKINPDFFGFSAYTGSGRLIRYNLTIAVTMATPGNLYLAESPLIVKYRW